MGSVTAAHKSHQVQIKISFRDYQTASLFIKPSCGMESIHNLQIELLTYVCNIGIRQIV